MRKIGVTNALQPMPLANNATTPTGALGAHVWSSAETAQMCWDGSKWTVMGSVAGTPGPPGPAGPQGLPGATGSQGPSGASGAVGAQGPQGTSGTNGAAGAQGPQGIQGIQGPQGNAGSQGPAGPTYAARVVLSGDLVSSVTALGDATGLSFAVSAGARYRFVYYVVFRSAALTTGIQLSINAPASTLLAYNADIPITATTRVLGNRRAVNVASTGTGVDVISVDLLAKLEGVIAPSASGSLILRFSSEVAASAVTIRAGSHGELVTIG